MTINNSGFRHARRMAFAAALATIGFGAVATAPMVRAADEAATLAADAQAVGQGTFEGLNGHITTGGVSVYMSDGKAVVALGDDFDFDGAPDPRVALARDGDADGKLLVAPLRENKGAQVYELPEGVDLADYNEVWIWCEQFTINLGAAKLSSND